MNGRYKIRVLLGIDGSEQSAAAATYLSRFLNPDKTEIVLFHVFHKIPESFWDLNRDAACAGAVNKAYSWEVTQREKAAEMMEWHKLIFQTAGFPAGSIQTRTKELERGVARDILDESRHGYSALVLGRLGVSRIKDLVFGSIAAKLLKIVDRIPICLVAGSPDPNNVLLAMDPSGGASRALDFLTALEMKGNHEVVLFGAVRMIEFPNGDKTIGKEFDLVQLAVMEDGLNRIKPVLDRARTRLIGAGVAKERVTVKVAEGVKSRAGAIIVQARESECGTIIMGRRGLSAPVEHPIGRVAEKTVHLARDKAVWIVN